MQNFYLEFNHFMLQDDLTAVSLDQLSLADNWQAKYRLLTEWGKLILPKQSIRLEQYRVKGCAASAWLMHSCIDEKNCFLFDSDSRVINGLAALLLSQINNQTTATLTTLNLKDMLETAGLQKHLTPSRSNGFKQIVDRVYETIN